MSHFVTLRVFDVKPQPTAMEPLDVLRKCLVCKWDLCRRDPRMLPCLHSFCKDCLPELIQGYSYISTGCEIVYEGNVYEPLIGFVIQDCKHRWLEKHFYLLLWKNKLGDSRCVWARSGWGKLPLARSPANSNALNRNDADRQHLCFPEGSCFHLPSVTLWIFALLKTYNEMQESSC